MTEAEDERQRDTVALGEIVDDAQADTDRVKVEDAVTDGDEDADGEGVTERHVVTVAVPLRVVELHALGDEEIVADRDDEGESVRLDVADAVLETDGEGLPEPLGVELRHCVTVDEPDRVTEGDGVGEADPVDDRQSEEVGLFV